MNENICEKILQEFMLATNMASSEEKLRFAFRMYDQDSSGMDRGGGGKIFKINLQVVLMFKK